MTGKTWFTGDPSLPLNASKAWNFFDNPCMTMIPIPRDFQEFLKLLAQHKVKHLLIGGYAVAYHGYVRTTGDMDVFVEASEVNALRLARACKEFGLGAAVKDSLFLEAGNVVRFGAPPMRLEILNQISGVAFTECWEDRELLRLGDLDVPVISAKHLIQNKRASDRAKDRLDVEMLADKDPS